MEFEHDKKQRLNEIEDYKELNGDDCVGRRKIVREKSVRKWELVRELG